jgi:hypothetical protein
LIIKTGNLIRQEHQGQEDLSHRDILVLYLLVFFTGVNYQKPSARAVVWLDHTL